MAGAAGTAALAFAGARREIANNTTVGKQFQAGIDTLAGHLHALEATAAAGVLSGFTDAVKALAPLMPAVGRDVAYMSTQLGQIMRSVLPGVVALFHQANPLFETFGDEAVKGAQAFNRWATSSTSVSTLVGYIETQLPLVEHTLAQVAEAAGRIMTALAPLGSASLSSIGLLARAINEIPMSDAASVGPDDRRRRGGVQGVSRLAVALRRRCQRSRRRCPLRVARQGSSAGCWARHQPGCAAWVLPVWWRCRSSAGWCRSWAVSRRRRPQHALRWTATRRRCWRRTALSTPMSGR
jgi:hypothetical protein